VKEDRFTLLLYCTTLFPSCQHKKELAFGDILILSRIGMYKRKNGYRQETAPGTPKTPKKGRLPSCGKQAAEQDLCE